MNPDRIAELEEQVLSLEARVLQLETMVEQQHRLFVLQAEQLELANLPGLVAEQERRRIVAERAHEGT